MRISIFIAALIVVGVIATTFTMAIVDLSDRYGATYDNTTLEVLGNTTALHSLTDDVEAQTHDLNPDSGIIDIVGGYISRAISALQLSFQSFSVFENMATSASDKIGLPAYFTIAAISIMLILLIIGVIVSAMIKYEL